MKRNDIGDSYVLGCSSRSLRRGECMHQADDHALCWKHSAQPSRVSPVDAQKGYAGMPTIGNALSLLFPFHSPAPWEASQCGVDAEPQVFMLLLLRYGLETKALIFLSWPFSRCEQYHRLPVFPV